MVLWFSKIEHQLINCKQFSHINIGKTNIEVDKNILVTISKSIGKNFNKYWYVVHVYQYRLLLCLPMLTNVYWCSPIFIDDWWTLVKTLGKIETIRLYTNFSFQTLSNNVLVWNYKYTFIDKDQLKYCIVHIIVQRYIA